MRSNVNVGFDEDQKAEIQAGMKAGLDVRCYAKPEFLAIQMRQIRIGMEEGLDVSAYCIPEYDWFQMEEIRLGIKAGVNHSLYAKPSIDYQRMRQIRLGLEKGIDMSLFAQLEAGILGELREAVAARISIVDYIKDGYQADQLAEIRAALEMKLDIRPYISVDQMSPSIREIRLGLEQHLPVSIYANMEYNWRQMREIRLGLEENLNIDEYVNPLFSWQQMREIRLGLEAGIDVSAYNSFLYTGQEMERIRTRILREETEGILAGVSHTLSDEYITVFISNDEMEACIEVDCEDGSVITAADIQKKLKSKGVSQGLLPDEIETIVQEKKYHQTIVIAKGKEPKRGEDGRFEFFFNTNPTREPHIMEDGTADFRAINWYEVVKEGQKIAYYHEATFGTSGYTVTGKFLKPRRGIDKGALIGKNIVMAPDKKTYTAGITGKIDLLGDHRVDITHVWVLDEVNLTTGDINFEGSVYVNGNVARGSTIVATDNIVIAGFVEGATIKCGGDVCLRKGMNGGGVGVIEARGNVMGQFFEAARVLSGGDVSAHYCLNSEVSAVGKVSIYGKKGMIAGGVTRGAQGITAYTVGNRAKITTILNAGIDNAFMNNLWQLEGRIEGVNKELAILNNSYEDFKKKYSPEIRNAMEIFIKIENAIYTKNQQLKELKDELTKVEAEMNEMMGAKVSVGGVMYEGTEVIIDNVKWKAFEISDVIVRCRNRKIVVESN